MSNRKKIRTKEAKRHMAKQIHATLELMNEVDEIGRDSATK